MIAARLFLLGMVLAVAAPAAAHALSAAQAAAVDRLAASPAQGKSVAATMASHYAVLLWVEDYCNGRSDESVRNYVMRKGAGNEPEFETGWTEALGLLDKADPQAMCALALDQYGPAGALIPGGWAPK